MPPGDSPLLVHAPSRHRSRTAFMALIGAGAVAAVVAFFIVLLSPASQHPLEGSGSTGDTVAAGPITTLAGPQNTVPPSAQAAGHSMVELRATTANGTVALVGVAVAEGGVIATTADLLRGATHVGVVGPSGKLESASVVGTDADSDVALVSVPEDLPVAPFADDATVEGGAPDLVLSYVPAGGTAVALHCTPGSVTGVGGAIPTGPAAGMPSITTSAPPAASNGGALLLTASGSVVGLLYEPAAGAPDTTFLPSQLVVGVADDLRSGDRVAGWLGIEGTDAPGDTGAKVETVSAGSPAAAGKLQPGQVVVAVDSLPVRTMAELRARIYVLPPGSAVTLSLRQPPGTATKAVGVTLGRSS